MRNELEVEQKVKDIKNDIAFYRQEVERHEKDGTADCPYAQIRYGRLAALRSQAIILEWVLNKESDRR